MIKRKIWDDKHEPQMVAGDAYLDEERAKLVIQGYKKKVSIDTSTFPLQDLVPGWWDDASRVLRYFITHEGEDSALGTSWGKATTFKGLFEKLSNIGDLLGHTAFVFVAPGIYEISEDHNLRATNGEVRFYWFGSTLKSTDSAFSNFALRTECPATNDNEIEIKQTENVHFFLGNSGKSAMQYKFQSQDENIPYGQPEKFFAYKWIFSGLSQAASWSNFVYVRNSSIEFEHPVFDVKGTSYFLYLESHDQEVVFRSLTIKAIGGVGDADDDKTSVWRGAIIINGSNKNILVNVDSAGGGLNCNPIAPVDADLSLDNWNGGNVIVQYYPKGEAKIVFNSYNFVNGTTTANIIVGESISGKITYNESKLSISDHSLVGHTLKELVSGKTKSYFGQGFYSDGTNLFYNGNQIATV